MHSGKSLSQWLHQYRTSLVDAVPSPELDARRVQAEKAIISIGPNAVPTLLSWASQKEPTWQYYLPYKLRESVATFRDRHGLYGRDPFADAMAGFDILGTNASAAIPGLANLMNDPDSFRSRLVTVALSQLGPEALPYVTAAMSRGEASQRWWYCRLLAENLLPLVNSTNQLPFLLNTIHDESEDLRNAASNAVRRIAPELLTNTPAK